MESLFPIFGFMSDLFNTKILQINMLTASMLIIDDFAPCRGLHRKT